MNCLNCGAEYNGNFCPKCGRPAQLKSSTYYTGQIISMFLMIAGLFGIVLSIGPLSSVRVIKAQITLGQGIIVSPLSLFEAIPKCDISAIAWFLIPLFYFSLVLLIAASIFFLLKRTTVKNILASVSLIITTILGIVIQSPIYFFIALNVGLLAFMLLLLIEPNHHTWNICWTITLPILFLGNIILLVIRPFLVDELWNGGVERSFVLSIFNVFMLLLWCIPCIVNLVTLFRLKGNERRWGVR